MNATRNRVKSLFLDAVENCPPERWESYLEEACGGDAELHRRVRALLDAHQSADNFVEESNPAAVITAAHVSRPGIEEISTSIGPYKLMEAIGEGGMGTVYLAEQAQPVRRRVALKVIKPGMDSKQVVARFEAERQALALMDHPNIAKVHDAGMTSTGRPYFVMELVRGIPITDYCDREQLSIRERLELFTLVCRAVQHAHQKGIIHRDLKPSNVLVTVIDGVPVPKVIDFGVAKATGEALTDKTLFTGFHQFVGTPLYMSPEQADLAGTDFDTRSDIYSLGVLLYELLTGTTPFNSETLGKAAFDEMRRIIREVEPPKPSTRLSTLGEALTATSARRSSDPRYLKRSVRGELDWIVMKALEKDRRRRYETANDFAADVLRFLTDRAVEACPPSAWYRFKKFIRRNRQIVIPTALLTLLTVLGLSIGMAVVTRERDEARAQRQRANARFRLAFQAVSKLNEAAGHLQSAGGPERTARLRRAVRDDLLRFYLQIVADEDDPEITYQVGDAYLVLKGLYGRSDPERAEWAFARVLDAYERRAREKPDDPGVVNALAFQYCRLAGRSRDGDPQRAEALYRHSLGLYERLARTRPDRIDDWVLVILVADSYGGLLRSRGRAAEAEALDRRTLAWFTRPECDLSALDHGEQLQDGYAAVSGLLARCGRPLEAISVLRRARPLLVFDGQYDAYSGALAHLSLRLAADPDPAARARAVELARENLEIRSPNDAHAWLVLGHALERAGDLRGSDEAFRRVLELHGAPQDNILNNLAWRLVSDPPYRAIRPAWAVRMAERGVELDPGRAAVWNTLGVARYRARDWVGAIEALEKSEALAPDESLAFNGFFLAMAHWRLGDQEKARTWYGEAVRWMHKNQPQNDQLRVLREEGELSSFRVEAEELLDIKANREP